MLIELGLVLTRVLFDFSLDFLSDSCANSSGGNFDILAMTDGSVVVVVAVGDVVVFVVVVGADVDAVVVDDVVVVVVVVDDDVPGEIVVVDAVVGVGAAVFVFVVDLNFLCSDFS